MRRRVWGWVACGALLLQGGSAVAQDSLKALEDDLAAAKQQHDDVTSQTMSNFFGQVDAAMGSPDAAVALYEQAGGSPPDPSPVITQHEAETETEKQARLAIDQANTTKLGVALQLHCGLMHYAALFVTKPDQKGLQDDFVAWLKSAAQIYPQLAMPPGTGDQAAAPQHRRKRDRDQDGDGSNPPKPQPPFNPSDIKGKAMHDSIISKYLGFKAWGDKEQGGWSVKDLPQLYRSHVLDPLRTTPTDATLAAWDVFIGMANADETDNDRWNQVVYPPLQFDRACDDYTVSPSTEKLENLVNLIKANPTYPQVDDWIARAKHLMDDYRSRHGGNPSATPAASTAPTTTPTTAPNVTVTTEQQGDATVITTHTNAAPAAPTPPAH